MLFLLNLILFLLRFVCLKNAQCGCHWNSSSVVAEVLYLVTQMGHNTRGYYHSSGKEGHKT